MAENRVGSLFPGENVLAYGWRDLFARCALIFFGIALWQKWSLFYAFFLLTLAWVIDGGLQKFGQLVKEPLVFGVLTFCGLLALGLLWGEYAEAGQNKWKKYFIFLTFIPFFALLNKPRLPWAMAAFIVGYVSVLTAGIYQWFVLGEQGVPFFEISYLAYSAMLGIGILLVFYIGSICQTRKMAMLCWFIAFLLLFLQFNQNARSLLLATVFALLLLIFLRYRTEVKLLFGVFASIMVAIFLFAMSSPIFQERLVLIGSDLKAMVEGNYSTSLGYRYAIWDIGMHGIAEKPLLGHGTGRPEVYFEETIQTYKNGLYKGLPEFHKTSHYHNDWIEIGMHLGGLGILTLALLMWSWYRTFKIHRLSVFGAALICYVFLAGLSDTFLLYNRIPILLLAVTAMAVCWQRSVSEMRPVNVIKV